MDSKHRDSYLSLVVLRVPVRERKRGGDKSDVGLIVVGYANTPDYFDKGVSEFARFPQNVRAGEAEQAAKDARRKKVEADGRVVFDIASDTASDEVGKKLIGVLRAERGRAVVVTGVDGSWFSGTLLDFKSMGFASFRIVVKTEDGVRGLDFDKTKRIVVAPR